MSSNTYKEHIKPIVVLTVICLIASFALSYTNKITAPVIEQHTIEEAAATRKLVLPDADNFEDVTEKADPDLLAKYGINDVYKASNGSGYVVTANTKGYGGTITIMIGMNDDGTVVGSKITNHSETAGLGAKTADDAFQSQYAGKTAGALEVVKGSASGDQILAVTGATISSKAVTLAVNNTANFIAEFGGAQ